MADLNARIIAKASGTTGEEPVAGDLEVAELAVNTADGKLFTKHTDNSIVTISGGGGGGAVDSVNGQTGVVVLDIQDLENVEYNSDPNANSFYLSGPTSTNPSSSGQWVAQNTSPPYFAWYNADPIDAWLGSIPIGTTIEFMTQGGYVHTAVNSTVSAPNSGSSNYLRFAGYTWPQEILDAYTNNEPLTVREQGADAPVAPNDGEILVYNSTDDAWRPGAALTSLGELSDVDTSTTPPTDGQALVWNNTDGEWQPGVAAMNIQDLSNVEYNPNLNTFNLSGDTTNNPNGPGDWGLQNGTPPYFVWYNADPVNAWLSSLPTGTTIEFVTQNGDVHTAVNSSVSLANSGTSNYMQFAGYTWPQEFIDAYTFGESITVREPGVTLPGEGDILAYDTSENKWRPAAAPTGAVASVAGKTGAVTLELLDNTDVGPSSILGLLVDFDGGDGSTVFTESNGRVSSFNPVNGATQSSTQVKYGASSYQGGASRWIQSNDLIGTAAETEVSFGTGDFTVEFWVYIPTGTTTAFQSIFGFEGVSGTNELMKCTVRKEGASGNVDALTFALGTGSGAATTVINQQNQDLYDYDTWHHVAICRSSGTLKSYVDGVELTSASDTTDIGSSMPPALYWNIGRTVPVGDYFYGYLDNLYITSTAKYTADFTPGQAVPLPAPPSDGQVLAWVQANNQWEASDPAVAVINDLEDVTTTAALSQSGGQRVVSTGSPNGRVQTQLIASDILIFGLGDVTPGSTLDYLVNSATLPVTIRTYPDGVQGADATVTNVNGAAGGGQVWVYADWDDAAVNAASTFFIEATGGPSDGQVLTWVEANGQWESSGFQGSAVRAALGIGEYADDAAAGTGGVTSGAMYYNTTSSDYRLKT